MWVAFWLWLGSTALSMALAKAPGNAKASSIDGAQLPTAREGGPLYIVLGTCEISGPNVTWWGDVRSKAITKKTSGFFGIGSKKYTVGYRYSLGMQMALCSGPIDSLEDILIGEKSLKAAGETFPRTFSESGLVFNVNEKNLFGGEEREGGVEGDIAFYFGSRTQNSDSYLVSKIGKALPAYRDVCYAVFRRFYIGTTPYLKAIKWRVRGCPVGPGMSASYANINGNTNAAHALAYLLTLDPEAGGLGVAPNRLNLTSFNAVASTLGAEQFGISLLLDTQQGADEWMEEILGTVDGVLYTDPATGLWTVELIRNDYVPANLLHLQRGDGLLSLEVETPSWSETVNRVVIEYTDRAAGFVTATAQDVDQANRAIQGRDVSVNLRFPAIPDRTTAQKVAGREKHERSYPLRRASLTASRKAWKLHKGSPFRLSSVEDELDEVVFRVTNIRYGALEEGRITIEAVEDIFGVLESATTPPPPSEWEDPLAMPVAVAAQILVEAPYGLQGEVRNVLALGARGDETTESLDVWTNEGAGYLQTATVEPMPSGILAGPWSSKTAALDTTGFTVEGGDDLDLLPAMNTNADGRARGDNLGICGNEWFSWTTAVDNGNGTLTLSGVLRGILDTVPEDHAAGDRVWFLTSLALTRGESQAQGSGTQGEPGDVGMNWRGAYSASTTYNTGDGVAYQGSSFISLQDGHSGQTPNPDGPTSYWGILAHKGDQGIQGIQGPGGVSTFDRTTLSATTASLAPGATGILSLAIKRTADLLYLETDFPAWVRVYGTSAARSADASRPQTQDYAPGSGCFLDADTADALLIPLSPVPVFVNGDSPVDDVAYLAVTNLDSVARAITVELTYLPQEA